MSGHRHKMATSGIQGYTGGVAVNSRNQEPRAAGGICVVEKCACGAVRKVNKNGRHAEAGPWCAPGVSP